MQNKKFIILISAAALVIIGLFGFMLYSSLVKEPADGAPSSPVELTDFGPSTPTNGGTQPAENIQPTQPEIPAGEIAPINAFKLKKISELPIVGATVYEKERPIEGLAPLSFSFENDLKLNDTNKDVESLQIFLNSIVDVLNPATPLVGPIVAKGAGSPGKESDYFGPATKEALIRFQNKYIDEVLTPIELKEDDGIFAGPTRAKVNSLLGGASGELLAKLTGPQKQTETNTALRYVDLLAGNIYETFVDNINEKRVSNTQIFGIHDAVFGNNGQSVVLRYLKGDPSTSLENTRDKPLGAGDATIESFLGNIAGEVLGGDSPIDLKGYFLPENMLGISTSPDGKNMFYLFRSNNRTVGINSSLESGKNVQIFDSPFGEWLTEWTNQRLITLATKPSYAAPGFVYSLDPADGIMRKILGGVPGLTAKLSPDGKSVLYSGSDLFLKIYDVINKTVNDLGLRSLPEKCVWSNDNINVFCSIPKEIPVGNYPDSWYQGEASFDDVFWKIDTKTNAFSLLNDPMADINEDIDGTSLFLAPREDSLFLINKKDSILWGLGLN